MTQPLPGSQALRKFRISAYILTRTLDYLREGDSSCLKNGHIG